MGGKYVYTNMPILLPDIIIELLVSITQVEIDTDSSGKRHEMQQTTIPSRLHKDNIVRYHVPWLSGGVTTEQSLHAEYLSNLGKDLVNGVTRLVQEAKLDLDVVQLKSDKHGSNFVEILTHLRQCTERVAIFRGYEEVLEQIRTYIEDDACRKPLVVHGDSGTGKSCLMAELVAMLPTWFGRDTDIVVRFLGTTPESSDIYDVIMSIITQLSDLHHVPLDSLGYRNISTLSNYFPKFLRVVGRSIKHNIFVLMDGLDQLDCSNKAYSLRWLPTVLPSNVHVIVSTRCGEVLDNARFILKSESLVCLGDISEENARDIIDSYMAYHDRQLTSPQTELVVKHFNRSPTVHYLRVLLDQALTWTSNMAANIIKSKYNIVLQIK